MLERRGCLCSERAGSRFSSKMAAAEKASEDDWLGAQSLLVKGGYSACKYGFETQTRQSAAQLNARKPGAKNSVLIGPEFIRNGLPAGGIF